MQNPEPGQRGRSAPTGQPRPQKTIRKPTYTLDSVDNALRLLQMLRDQGAIRVKDAAAELGTAPSTAHRLLGMLVYRGFAVQDERHLYHPGPAMGAGPAQQGWTRQLTDACRPHLEALAIRSGETVNLVIRVGSQVRFLATAESSSMLRVGDRQGQVLPAERTAGGRILLAELDGAVLEQLYLRRGADGGTGAAPAAGSPSVPEDAADPGDRRLAPAAFEQFAAELRAARTAGFAINLERTEEGVAAFGMAVHNRAGQAVGAVSVAVPSVRYQHHLRGPLLSQLREAVRGVEIDIADISLA